VSQLLTELDGVEALRAVPLARLVRAEAAAAAYGRCPGGPLLRTWRNMNGYASSTYMWENAAGKKFWVKYHFKTEQGIQNFTDAEARAMRAEDLDYHRRDIAGEAQRGALRGVTAAFADASEFAEVGDRPARQIPPIDSGVVI